MGGLVMGIYVRPVEWRPLGPASSRWRCEGTGHRSPGALAVSQPTRVLAPESDDGE